MASAFYRVREHETGRSYFIRATSVGELTIAGIEVDREGSEIRPAGHDQRLRVIHRAAATFTPYEEDRKYGTLRKITAKKGA